MPSFPPDCCDMLNWIEGITFFEVPFDSAKDVNIWKRYPKSVRTRSRVE